MPLRDRIPDDDSGERDGIGAGDRGQAYTLEGFVGAIVVLTAVLLALQSIVITPTTGGSIDRTVQAQLQQEVQDALTVAANDGELSGLVRYWNESQGQYHNDTNVPRGVYSSDEFADPTTMDGLQFGALLDGRFTADGRNYNVVVAYRTENESETASFPLVYQSQPTPSAVVASYTVTLTDDQTLTAPGDRHRTLEDAADDHPIPNAVDGPTYNVVELRVIVW